MADHEPGRMEIDDQEKMYDDFWKWSFRTAYVVAAVLAVMYFTLT